MVFQFFINELKCRLHYSMCSFMFTFISCYLYSSELLHIFTRSLIISDLILLKKFIFIDMTEGFRINIFISFFIAFCIILPFVTYNIFSFVSPGLYSSFRQDVISNIVYIFNFAYIVAFAILFVIFPIICDFFLTFEQKNTITNIVIEPRISLYIYFALNLLGSFLVIMFFIILLYLLIDCRYIHYNILIDLRKYSYIFILLISAFFSPPDLLNQLLLSSILIVVYEWFIFYSMLIS